MMAAWARFIFRGGQRREWDLYLRAGHQQDPAARPVYRYAGRQVTGA